MDSGDYESSAVLKTVELTKQYRQTKALDMLSIELKQGHIYGLVGNNGSGKTTLLRIIMGLSYPSSGELELFGKSGEKQLRAARKQIGALVETPAFYEDLSVRQNLIAAAMLYGPVDKKRIKELCELLGITEADVGRGQMRNCSLGQKQRYGIAAALLAEPKMLVLDEPLNGLDPSGVRDVRTVLSRLFEEQHTTMLISSHMLEELHRLATDYIFINNGKLIKQTSAEELDHYVETAGLDNVEDYFIKLLNKEII